MDVAWEYQEVSPFGGSERLLVGHRPAPGLEVEVRCDLDSHGPLLFLHLHIGRLVRIPMINALRGRPPSRREPGSPLVGSVLPTR